MWRWHRAFRTPIRPVLSSAAARLTTAPAQPVTVFDNFLRVDLGAARLPTRPAFQRGDFHLVWLRHNCPCQQGCRHAKTGERLVDPSEIIANARVALGVESAQLVHPSSADLCDSSLRIEWSDGHRSQIPLPFLAEHSYATNHGAISRPSNDTTQLELDYRALAHPSQRPAYRRAVKELLHQYGAVVVRHRGLDTEAIIADFLPQGRDVVHTHFGRIEDLRTDNTTNVNTDQLGYTDAPVHLHTDQPFIAAPPDMQLLQCMRPADHGGENLILDARAATRYLRQTDPTAYHILTTTPLVFSRKQKAFESQHVSPILRVDAQGELLQIRYSYFSMAPFHLPFDQMLAWYAAYTRFSQLARHPANHYRIPLNAGDFVLYDNFLCLHAREAFKGPRWMRGVYFMKRDVLDRLNESD